MPRRTEPTARTEPAFAPASLGRWAAGPAGRLRRGLAAGAVAAAGALAAGPAAAAGTGDDGVVSLSAGPAFGAPAAAPVSSPAGGMLSAAYEEPAGPAAGSILPAGFVAPRAPRGPFAPMPPAGTVGPAGGPVVPAGYAPGAAYCPPGAAGGGFAAGGFAGGGGNTAYRAKRGRGGRAGSLWTRLTSYRPPEETFVRLEYLQYAIAGEETGLVGAPIEGVTTDGPSVIFPFGEPLANDRTVNDEDSDFTIPFSAPFAPAVAPLLNNFEVEDFQGVRVTFGRPVNNVGRGGVQRVRVQPAQLRAGPGRPAVRPDDAGGPHQRCRVHRVRPRPHERGGRVQLQR